VRSAARSGSAGWSTARVRDYERLPRHSEAALTWTAITLMTRRLARGETNSQAQLQDYLVKCKMAL